MNLAEIDIPDHVQGAATSLAMAARAQDRIQEAMQVIAQPTALGALQDALEGARPENPALRMTAQARELASVTDKIAEQMRPALAISEQFDPPVTSMISQRLAEQHRRIDEAVGDMTALARIEPSPLSEFAAKSPVTGLGLEMDQIRESTEALRRLCPDLSEFDTPAGLRDSIPNWPQITPPDLEPGTAAWQPALYRDIDPVSPLTRESEPALPIVEPARSDVPAENREGYAHVFALENALRRFVSEQLAAAFGPDWEENQVPDEIRQEWQDKREQARAAGDTDRPLIAYADLDDYRKIIARKDNWREAFKPFFARKEFVSEHFHLLHAPRNAIAHNRPLTTQQLELVRVGTHLLLRAIGETDRP